MAIHFHAPDGDLPKPESAPHSAPPEPERISELPLARARASLAEARASMQGLLTGDAESTGEKSAGEPRILPELRPSSSRSDGRSLSSDLPPAEPFNVSQIMERLLRLEDNQHRSTAEFTVLRRRIVALDPSTE
ncbi:MAG: hypothetical protein ACR2PL_13045, partial [Dehalococcoidia bacterium]